MSRKPIFTPEDFGGGYANSYTSRFDAIGVAQIANAKLAKLIESWPVVYGATNGDGHWVTKEWKDGFSTHYARLAFIEEIEKEPCKHFPESIVYSSDGRDPIAMYSNKCLKCGIEIEPAEWKEKK